MVNQRKAAYVNEITGVYAKYKALALPNLTICNATVISIALSPIQQYLAIAKFDTTVLSRKYAPFKNKPTPLFDPRFFTSKYDPRRCAHSIQLMVNSSVKRIYHPVSKSATYFKFLLWQTSYQDAFILSCLLSANRPHPVTRLQLRLPTIAPRFRFS